MLDSSPQINKTSCAWFWKEVRSSTYDKDPQTKAATVSHAEGQSYWLSQSKPIIRMNVHQGSRLVLFNSLMYFLKVYQPDGIAN